MGLKIAVKAHSEGDLALAEQHYKRAYQQGDQNPVLYQNYGALLRSTDRLQEAIDWYEKGLKLFPDNVDIAANYANSVRTTAPSKAIEVYIDVFKAFLFSSNDIEKSRTHFLNLCSFLYEKGFFNWNLLLINKFLPYVGVNVGILQNLLLLADHFAQHMSSEDSSKLVILQNKLEDSIASLPESQTIDIHFALFQHYLNRNMPEMALSKFKDAQNAIAHLQRANNLDLSELERVQKNIDVNYWNAACTFLKFQNFERGWQMFDFGLRAPCAGQQRWQRSLAKPFSASQLPLWKGQSLTNQSILLLEEQGVGDAMMFITLVPALIEEAKVVSLFLSDRLVPVYRKAFAKEISLSKVNVFSRKNFYEKSFRCTDFDFQSPLGSICQYRFTHPKDYSPKSPVLRCDTSLSSKLRSKYLNYNDKPVSKLIGVSWRGGGRSGRILQKSIDTDQFGSLMKDVPNVRFVSLQYGESKSIVNAWASQGIDIIHDDNIDPMKDLYNWLSQVHACDAVLSVANTTIHGAGGLNIPTYCLLSKHADWRWIASDVVQRSYWYPSVGIFREDKNSGWSDALRDARTWLESGTPLPSGPICE